MSRDWTPAELQAVSQAMKAAGHMSFEEFCEGLERANHAGATRPGTTRKEYIMEEVYEYRTDPPIEGLRELRAAILAWDRYHYLSAKYLEGDIHERPVAPTAHIGKLNEKYPRAAAYVKADDWANSAGFIKSRFGRIACQKIAAGADHDEVLKKMEADYAAFSLAQEG